MYLHVIVAYFLLLWWPDRRPFGPVITATWATILFVGVQPPLIWLAARLASAGVRRPDRALAPNAPSHTDGAWRQGRTQHLYHQASFLVTIAAVVGFAANVLLTTWPDLVRGTRLLAAVPGVADVVILIPFFVSLVLVWVASYPVDRAVREAILRTRQIEGAAQQAPSVWTLGQYISFNVRHQLLIAAVPMTLILVAFDAARDYRATLVQWLRVPWADQAVLGLAAILVFVFAPVMLRCIWSTSPLPDGPLRRRLEGICRQVGLRYREILIWRSHHMMVNAAVMGIFAPVRYILLSDAMLESMSTARIEAVFGHEAGHVRHRHIQYFLLFAVSGMLIVSGLIELLIRSSMGPDAWFQFSETTIQVIGFVGVLFVWGIGFGWVSRRFERQADVFGARCLASTDPGCTVPCSRHAFGKEASGSSQASSEPDVTGGFCASAASVFVSALDRVAVLNGIPHNERSWRHSSIRSRMRFLTALAGDAGMVRRFDRLIRRIKLALWITAVGGLVVAAVYISQQPEYRDVFLDNFVRPFRGGAALATPAILFGPGS